MKICHIYFASLFVLCHADPQLRYLNEIRGSAYETFSNIEIGANVFLASNDNAAYLKNIMLQVGQNTYTLDQLAKQNPDGKQFSLTVVGKVTLSTTNDDSITNILTGFLYITTAIQANDPNFAVYVSGNLTIENKSPVGVLSTTVILNTELPRVVGAWFAPSKSSYVSNIIQPKTTTMHILRGAPSSNSTKDDIEETVFKNPMPLTSYDANFKELTEFLFFEHIEPLQLGVDCYFIKANGSFSLTVDHKWTDFTDYHTNAITTTGLIMTETLFKETNVRFELNPANSRTSGTFNNLKINDYEKLSIMFFDSQSIAQQNYTGPTTLNGVLAYPGMQAVRLTVSTSTSPGYFYIQYFGIDGDPLPTTPSTTSTSTTEYSVRTTTTRLQTTTKLSSSISLLSTIFVILCKLTLN